MGSQLNQKKRPKAILRQGNVSLVAELLELKSMTKVN